MYSEIVPSDIQDELITLRDNLTRSSFRIGDIALQIIAGTQYGVEAVYSAVGSFVGKSSRTIREYASVSAFYPDEVRQMYDLLSFDHFRVAMRFGSNWLEALEWSVSQVEEVNRPATVDAMVAEFATPKVTTPETEAKFNWFLSRLKDALLTEDVHLPKELYAKLLDLIEEIENVIRVVV